MNRTEKYKILRINKRVSYSKRFLFIISLCSFILFSLSTMTLDTYSFFNAQFSASMNLTNATKEELVEITEGEVIYEDKCIAKHSVKVKNIFDYLVKISIDGTEYIIEPGNEITHTQIVADNCGDFGEKNYNIIGYEKYFEHPIFVVVDKNKLNPCPQPAIDNANGRENDNGNGKHCGNQGNHVHDGTDGNNETQETQETEETQETQEDQENQENPGTVETDVSKDSSEVIGEGINTDENPEQSATQDEDSEVDTSANTEEKATKKITSTETNTESIENSNSEDSLNQSTEDNNE